MLLFMKLHSVEFNQMFLISFYYCIILEQQIERKGKIVTLLIIQQVITFHFLHNMLLKYAFNDFYIADGKVQDQKFQNYSRIIKIDFIQLQNVKF